MRRYLFALAVLMSLALVSQGQCQSMSSDGNLASNNIKFKPIDTSKLAAPPNTVAMKNSQGSMMSNVMQRFSMPNFFKSSKPIAPTGPLGRSQALKNSSSLTTQQSAPYRVASHRFAEPFTPVGHFPACLTRPGLLSLARPSGRKAWQ